MSQKFFYLFQKFYYMFHLKNLECFSPCLKQGQFAVPVAMGVGALVGAAVSADYQHDQIKHDEDMFEKQKEFELQKFNLQNEYNDPLKQVQRFRNAGLNPALMAGSGSVSSGNSAGIGSPSQGANVLHPSQLPDFLKSATDIGMSFPQSEQVQAQTGNIEANTQRTKLESDWLPLKEWSGIARNISEARERGINTKVAEKELEFQSKSLNDRIESIRKENFFKEAQTEFTKVQKQLAEADIKLRSAEYDNIRAQCKATLSKLSAEVNVLRNQAFALAASGQYDMSKMTTEEVMRGYESKLKQAYTDATKDLNEREQRNFDNFWLRFIVPALGGTGSMLGGSALMLMRFK